jgi:flagellar motility protein MotE (MotC chaperone)
MPIKLNKDFLKAVEAGVIALEKAAPTIAEPVKKILKGGENRPDIGQTQMAEYSPFESRVQTAENIDSAVSNASFLAETEAGLNLLSKLGAIGLAGGKVLSTVGQVAEPIQETLWGLDAVRTLASPKYRAEAQKAVEATTEASPSDTAFSGSLFTSALARPTSTAQGELDTISQLETDQINEQLKQERLDRQMRRLLEKAKAERATILGHRSGVQDNRDVPAVGIRNANQRSEQQAAQRYFK